MKKAPTESDGLAKPPCIGTAPGREPTGGETRRGKPPVIGLVIPCSPVIAGWLKTAAARHADSPAGAIERALEVLLILEDQPHMEVAAMMPIWRDRRTGKGEDIPRCAASMVLETWEFADQLRRSSGKCAGELIHESSWANTATAKILRKLELGSAVAGVVQRSTAGRQWCRKRG